MLFCHIIDDYYLQGWFAQAKQKSWWEKKVPDKMYRNDYKIALIEHAFSWTFMIHVPVIIALNYYKLFDGISIIFIFIFVANWIYHAIIDDMKANKRWINLIQDQTFHFIGGSMKVTCEVKNYCDETKEDVIVRSGYADKIIIEIDKSVI